MAARIQRQVPAASGRAPSAGRASGKGSQGPRPKASVGTRRVRRRVPLKHLVQFTRLLATLTEAGLPVLRNLKILSEQWPPGRFKDTVLDTADLVEEGQTLSDAFATHPEVFDELYVNMARAGEAGGVLDTVLGRLAEFMERSQRIRDRTRSALIYPIVIFLVAIGVISALMIFVIPEFTKLFEEMGVPLPGITRALMDASSTVKAYWFLFIGLPVLLFLGYQLLYLRSYGFRRWNHGWWMKMPAFGRLGKLGQVSRFASTFGTLIASGVPHLRAFDIVRGSLTNEIYREAMDEIHEEVREGEAIATAMGGTGLFDDVVVSMVEVGEETGELDRMCLRVGANYEENYNRNLDVVLRLLEPLMMVFMAVVVGFIALALFLPIFEMLPNLGTLA